METVKEILYFCNTAIFYDYTNVGITCELNQVRKCIINSFCKTIPNSRIRMSLSIIDDKILKILDNDNENNIENIHDLRENIIYMISFEELSRDEQQTIKAISVDDEEKNFKENKIYK